MFTSPLFKFNVLRLLAKLYEVRLEIPGKHTEFFNAACLQTKDSNGNAYDATALIMIHFMNAAATSGLDDAEEFIRVHTALIISYQDRMDLDLTQLFFCYREEANGNTGFENAAQEANQEIAP